MTILTFLQVENKVKRSKHKINKLKASNIFLEGGRAIFPLVREQGHFHENSFSLSSYFAKGHISKTQSIRISVGVWVSSLVAWPVFMGLNCFQENKVHYVIDLNTINKFCNSNHTLSCMGLISLQ